MGDAINTSGLILAISRPTFSAWVKRSQLGTNQVIFNSGTNDGNYFVFNFNSGDQLSWHQYDGSGYDVLETTDGVFRDVAAWYNFVVAIDTTQGTAANRAKCYINGTQITSFETETYPDQNLETLMNHTTGAATVGASAKVVIMRLPSMS